MYSNPVACSCHPGIGQRGSSAPANQHGDLFQCAADTQWSALGGCESTPGHRHVIAAMHLDHPFHFDTRGRSSETSDDDYLRQLIELTLFTSPGERVHRPTFGSGLMQLLFASNSDAVAAATQVAVQGALQQWLGDLIEAQAVVIQSDDNQLQIEIRYLVRRNQRQQTATFTRSL